MHVKFDVDGSVATGWLMMSSHRQDISFNDEKSPDGVDEYHVVTWDEDGSAKFTYKDREVFVHDMHKFSMAELAERVNAQSDEGVKISSTDLAIAILCDGFENVRFGLSLYLPKVKGIPNGVNVMTGEIIDTVCKLRRDFNREPHECYKLCFEIDTDRLPEGWAKGVKLECTCNMEMSDVVDQIKSGEIKILDSVMDSKTPEQHIDEYFAQYRKYSDAYVKMLAAE